MKKLPDSPSDVVFASVVFGRWTVKFDVVKFVSLNRVVLSVDTETGAVVFSVLAIMVVASFSTAKTSKAPELYQIKVSSGHEEHSYYNLQILHL